MHKWKFILFKKGYSNVGGHCCPGFRFSKVMLCRGEYFLMKLKSSGTSGSPNSGIHAGPIVNLWNRNMSITPTLLITAPNSCGSCCEQAATNNPPFDPPWIASLNYEGYDWGTPCRFYLLWILSTFTFATLATISPIRKLGCTGTVNLCGIKLRLNG